MLLYPLHPPTPMIDRVTETSKQRYPLQFLPIWALSPSCSGTLLFRAILHCCPAAQRQPWRQQPAHTQPHPHCWSPTCRHRPPRSVTLCVAHLLCGGRAHTPCKNAVGCAALGSARVSSHITAINVNHWTLSPQPLPCPPRPLPCALPACACAPVARTKARSCSRLHVFRPSGVRGQPVTQRH